MKFRSTQRRGISAITSTALAAGVLAGITMLASPAQAASTTVQDVAFSCSDGNPSHPLMPYTTDIAFDATWSQAGGRAEVSAHLLDTMTTPAPVSGGVNAVLGIKDHNNAASPKSGTLTGSDPDGFNAGVATGPEVKGTPVSIPGTTLKLTVESLDMTITPFNLPVTCTLAAPVAVPDLAVGLPTPAAGTAQLLCTTFGTTFYYPAATTVSAKRVSGSTKTDVTVAMSAMPGIVPLTLNDVPVTSDLDLAVNGTPVTAAGASRVATIPAYGSIPVPAAQGSATSSASTLDIGILDADFSAASGAMPVPIPCAMAAPFTASAVSVTTTPPPGPSAACIAAKAKLGPAQAAVNAATQKVNADVKKVAAAKKKVASATKAVKKAKKASKAKLRVAKKKLAAAKKALAAANKALAADKAKLAAAKSALTTANNAVKANC